MQIVSDNLHEMSNLFSWNDKEETFLKRPLLIVLSSMLGNTITYRNLEKKHYDKITF